MKVVLHSPGGRIRAEPSVNARIDGTINGGFPAVLSENVYADYPYTWHHVTLENKSGWIRSDVFEYEPIIGEVDIPIPYNSQLDPTAFAIGNDCGDTCVVMFLRYYLGKSLTVNFFSQYVPRVKKNDFARIGSLITAANQFDLPMLVTNTGTLPFFVKMLNKGSPVIALGHYQQLKSREDQRFTGSHFVVVRGYNESGVYLNDPDWKGKGGEKWHVTWAEFEAFIANKARANGNMPYQAMYSPLKNPIKQIDLNLFWEIVNWAKKQGFQYGV